MIIFGGGKRSKDLIFSFVYLSALSLESKALAGSVSLVILQVFSDDLSGNLISDSDFVELMCRPYGRSTRCCSKPGDDDQRGMWRDTATMTSDLKRTRSKKHRERRVSQSRCRPYRLSDFCSPACSMTCGNLQGKPTNSHNCVRCTFTRYMLRNVVTKVWYIRL